jgi:hypothetical protein
MIRTAPPPVHAAWGMAVDVLSYCGRVDDAIDSVKTAATDAMCALETTVFGRPQAARATACCGFGIE